ncbi:MAG: FkbM family methyltransferase [Pseudomonadota bacterium]
MSQVIAFNKLKQCRHGQMLFNINDQYIGRAFDVYGECNEGEINLFDQIVREGQVVVDVGANIGDLTLFFAKKVGLGGAVHAFEPQRLVFQTLCANMALNSIVNTFCHNAALGVERGEVVVPLIAPWGQEYNFGGMALGGHQQGERVPLFPLDDLGLTACHFIKIDVEGMELDVLLGAQALIRACRPVLYVENDRQDKSAPLIRHLDALDYALYWHRPFLYNPQNFANNPENIFGNIGSHNMLCLPRESGCRLEGFPEVEQPES